MINGRCRTNWDDAQKWTWPQQFVAVPRVGERVKAKEHGKFTVMQVSLVTHFIVIDAVTGEEEPMIEVELCRI